ncbi:MAG: amidase family protein [Planctomycetaceae bacterium]
MSLPHSRYGVATYYVIAPSEASSNLARYDGVHYGHRTSTPESLGGMYRRSRSEGFGGEVQRRIMLGCYALSSGYYDAYYLKARRVRRLVQQDYLQALGQVDLLIGPVTPGPAFKRGEMINDPLAMYMADIFTIGANLAGIPAISLPAGTTDDGLPLGVQLLGPVLGEEKLLRAARMFELAAPWDHAPRGNESAC